jgi:hypothetical protein
VIEKVLLVADVSPDAAALTCFEPIRLMLISSNVARPDVFVERVVVPLRVPVPDERVRVTARPAWAISFPDLSLI